MKFIKIFGVLAVMMPCMSFAASSSSDFSNASRLLSAARRGDTQTVQVLISQGANVNYVDSTGLSLVCTAVMNNDKRAIQVLQMYGADASNCDRQIQNYNKKVRLASRGEENSFFSGLPSSHVILLSAAGIAAVVGGVLLLTDGFRAKNNNNSSSSSGGSHSGGGSGGGGSSGTTTKEFTIPYGPAYLKSDGTLDTNTDVAANLSNWDTGSASELHKTDFNYLRQILTVNNKPTSQAILDGINPLLENYLLVMGGYYSFANGYMGQNIFRDSSTNAPLFSETTYQKQPVKVGVITGNGINPSGSADFANGIVYVSSTAASAETTRVDKYVNNTINSITDGIVTSRTEQAGFDLSGSGTVFNPYVDVNDSALVKIIAGWEGNRSSTTGDLYGFVPNGQLSVYRTGNGNAWNVVENATAQTAVGTFTNNDADSALSSGDTVVLNGVTYTIKDALSLATDNVIKIAGKSYKLSQNSKMLIGCVTEECNTDDTIGIYVGTDGAWYVNSNGGTDIDNVYIMDSNNIYTYKLKATGAYTNFTAIQSATGTADVIANTNVIPNSHNYDYLTVNNFTKAAALNGAASDLKGYYALQVTNNYGTYVYNLNGNTVSEAQGGVANTLFNNYSSSKPIIVMPAGDYLFKNAATSEIYYDTLDATFENYAPILYGGNLNHNFMTIVGVTHANGTSGATTIAGYGDGTGYGKLQLSVWVDSNEDIYSSRKCGIAGVGNGSVDPWCFAASGPTAEMATAAAAGAVASVKSAFSYMSNEQLFTLLALTADGPYLKANTSGTAFNTDTLVAYLKTMYQLPLEYNESSLSDTEYLAAFKDVFGYGLINLERAIKPGYSIYYYSSGNIVSADGSNNKFWGNIASASRSSTTLDARGTIRTSFYDVVESVDGSVSLPRVWTNEMSLNNESRQSLYMGDVLAEFAVDSTNRHTKTIGNMSFGMSLSPRAYNDNLNGLNDLNISFRNEKYDIDATYQRHLTDNESRFDGRANGILSLVSNAVTSDVKYKYGNFGFGAHAFSGTMSDENLLENDPAISSQFEPARLGFANGGAVDTAYDNGKFGLNISVGNMYESKTVLGALMDGAISLNGATTQYVDAIASYKPIEKMNLFARATFANTRANIGDGIVTAISDIKSNAFALGADLYGFNFTAAMPLAVVDGKMGYDYADLSVVENNGKYEVLVNNPHTEYINMTPNKRELRFSGSYKRPLGEFTDAGVGFIYRVNPGNTDAFGNESILMFKLHHRIGI